MNLISVLNKLLKLRQTVSIWHQLLEFLLLSKKPVLFVLFLDVTDSLHTVFAVLNEFAWSSLLVMSACP